MKSNFKQLVNHAVNSSLTIAACVTTLILLSSFLYADSGKAFLSKDEREWLAKNQSQITRAVETGYAPFVFIDSKDRPAGLAHDYMLLLESKLGVKFKEKRFSTLNEIFDKLKSGEVHIVNAVTNTPARSEFIKFTDPFITVPNVIIVQNKRSGPFKEETLNGLKVSLVKGYAVTEYFTNKGLNVTSDLVPDDITALYHVSSGHTDAAVIDLATASYLISTKGITNLRIAGETTFAIRLAMGTPIAEPMLGSIIQKGLAQITDAERKEIRNHWINASSGNIFADWRFWAVVIGALFALCAAIFGNVLWNRTLRRQVALRTEELNRETEALQKLKEELQEQNEELAVTEENLRFQNDQLMATEEMLRIQICEYDNSQKMLHDSEERFRLIMESVAVIPWEFNIPENRWTYVGPQVTDLLGYSPEEWTSLEWWLGIIHPDDQTWVPAYCADLTSRGEEHSMEYRLMAKDGSIVWVNDLVTIEMLDGKPNIMRGIIVDITERKQAEEKLSQSRQLLVNLANLVPGVIYQYRLYPDGRSSFPYASQGMNVIYEVTPEEVQEDATPVFGRLHPDDYENVASAIQESARTLQTFYCEFRVILPQQGLRWRWSQAQPERMPDGGTLWHGIISDITDRKQAEEAKDKLEAQLLQAQKMESVGRLAGGVAHDFNNLLTVILGGTYLALSELEPGQPLHEYVTQIQKAGEKATDLTQQLLAFARKQTIETKVLDLNDTVSGMLKMLQRLIGENTQLTWQPANNLWQVKADPSQIDQILANLCVNARDSIADIGTITIQTGNSVIDEGYNAEHADVIPGEYVHISVSDSGCGMDKATMAHIFEPFFTTKGIGEGTGLGLATVYGAAKQNNGFVNVYSELGIGTTFTIYLPRYVGNTEQKSAKDQAQPSPRGLETILLVEDEAAILNMVKMLLGKQGYTVLAANTPKEAVKLASEQTGEIDLLITDVIMPEMNGKDLAHNLMSQYPKLKCLFMSGYTADAIAQHGVLEEGTYFIHKPFSLPDLAVKVRKVLDGN